MIPLIMVVDASAAAAVVFREPEAETILSRVQDADLIAPDLINYELASVCLKKMKEQPKKADIALKLFSARRRLFALWEIEVAHEDVARLAADEGLSAYDAAYLWLSRQMNADLVTLDKRLAKVAAR